MDEESSNDDPGDETHPGAEAAVGDGRPKYVEVVTLDGDRHEHGDSYLRETEDAFFVSPEPEFSRSETAVYEKESLARVSVEQHHSACFVTTAVAGEEETLATLRTFRDDVLRPSPVGRPLVGVYERVSPPVADTLAENPRGRTARAVRGLVRRCAALARRREAAGPVGSAALSATLTALYVVGVGVAVAGHLATVGRSAIG
ncbi:CFI-box-CTERM domain-containing protein [Halobaculum sp. EA56]|uniref:CFI-box-CTERM domain-containing protein n=1 Tax=Halobaculum sp. EA56 TaxID=3421648 RepID=UPI003EBF3FED